jgi:putative glutamine amidotransferase
MNVFFGGSLYQDIDAFLPDALPHEKGALHDVAVDKSSMLYEIIGLDKLSVKSYHHQAIKEIGKGLKKCAESGDQIVEGIESTENNYILGIQWHPELEDGEISKKIFKSFIDECSTEE